MTSYVGFETGGYLDKLEKGSSGEPGGDNEIDLVAVNENDRALVLGECKRNPKKF